MAASQSFAELARAFLGESLSPAETLRRLGMPSLGLRTRAEREPVWLGTIGYERYKLNTDFARRLAADGIERLIDVRELPISRRRGYAKSALRLTLEEHGIEYLHVRALGNPKPIRDIYKSGQPIKGRGLYERYLLDEQRDALDALAALIAEKRTALMCLEHDAAACHRAVIVDALRAELGLHLAVVDLI